MYMRFLGLGIGHQGHVAANPTKVDAMDVDITEIDDNSNDMADGRGNDSDEGDETDDEGDDEDSEDDDSDEGDDSDEEDTGFDDF